MVKLSIHFARKAPVVVHLSDVTFMSDCVALLAAMPNCTHLHALHHDDYASSPYKWEAMYHLTPKADYIICGPHDRAWLLANLDTHPRLAKLISE